ncbi:hypothetical protein [Deinococcus sp. PESE-13]
MDIPIPVPASYQGIPGIQEIFSHGHGRRDNTPSGTVTLLVGTLPVGPSRPWEDTLFVLCPEANAGSVAQALEDEGLKGSWREVLPLYRVGDIEPRSFFPMHQRPVLPVQRPLVYCWGSADEDAMILVHPAWPSRPVAFSMSESELSRKLWWLGIYHAFLNVM